MYLSVYRQTDRQIYLITYFETSVIFSLISSAGGGGKEDGGGLGSGGMRTSRTARKAKKEKRLADAEHKKREESLRSISNSLAPQACGTS